MDLLEEIINEPIVEVGDATCCEHRLGINNLTDDNSCDSFSSILAEGLNGDSDTMDNSSPDDKYLDGEVDSLSTPYLINALEAITFQLYNNKYCDERLGRTFKPVMAHQIFGHREQISGYRNLKVLFHILPNSFHIYLEMIYDERQDNYLRGEIADDVPLKLSSWFPHLIKKKETFDSLRAKENFKVVYGTKLHEFKCCCSDGNNFQINICDIKEPGFKDFHSRFSAMIVWFIDAASVIDLKDENWSFFYIYKQVVSNTGTDKGYIPVGFCTVYYFSMSKRARISQIFILPIYQGLGLGTKLLAAVYKHYNHLAEVEYITVESPCDDFTRMRDKLDMRLLLHHREFHKMGVMRGFNQRMLDVAKRCCKLCPAQVKHIYTILRCYYTRSNQAFLIYYKHQLHKSYKRKLSRLQLRGQSQQEKAIRFRKIVAEDYRKNRRIHREAVAFIKGIKSQLQFIKRYLYHDGKPVNSRARKH